MQKKKFYVLKKIHKIYPKHIGWGKNTKEEQKSRKNVFRHIHAQTIKHVSAIWWRINLKTSTEMASTDKAIKNVSGGNKKNFLPDVNKNENFYENQLHSYKRLSFATSYIVFERFAIKYFFYGLLKFQFLIFNIIWQRCYQAHEKA